MQHRKPPALGRGLDELFGFLSVPGNATPASALIAVDQIDPCSTQPRRYFSEQDLTDLANSIAVKGVLQPILVRPKGEKRYELIAGERRWRAAQKAGVKSIPAMVKAFTDQESLEIALIENIQRQDLLPLEEAEGYQRLINDFSYTQETLAQALGKSRSHVSNYLRLLTLPDKVKHYLASGEISAGHARALINHSDAEKLVEKIVEEKLNVRATEKLTQQSTPKPTRHSFIDPEIHQIEAQLQQLLELKVTLKYAQGKGEARIHLNSVQELDHLLAKLSAAQ